MTKHERPLIALNTLLEFDLMVQGAVVAESAQHSDRAQRELQRSQERCDSVVRDLQEIASRSTLNPALLITSQELLRAERSRLQQRQQVFAAARESEVVARFALVQLQVRQRALARALEDQRRQDSLVVQARDASKADDWWLQHLWSAHL